MWRYQKPGFQALLLAELQRQQQCRHFCDTMLKTEDISVPAHSCVLSAISPHIASALSSTPSPPPGQSRLLEFQALGACTLLRVVRLMYSGEMAGEGEKEKQEAVSAAAQLGIHGLVEVTTPNEPTFETIDMTCLQNLRQTVITDSSVIASQIPVIPLSLLSCENQVPQASLASLQESAVSSVVLDLPPSFSTLFSRETASIVHPQSRRSSSQAGAGSEWDDSSFEQFKGNISAYISEFLNPEKQERRSRRGRPRGRRQAATRRGQRTARRGQRTARRAAGSARGGFTETVDVQEVGLSAAQQLFLQRWSTRSSRTGQGGGAAGRKLCLKTREKVHKRRRRGPEKRSLGSLNKDDPPLNEGGRAGAEGCSSCQVEAKPADSFLSPPSRLDRLCTAPASTASLHPSPWSSTGSCVSPAPFVLHGAAVPPPPQDEQAEQISRLLEEVMMGLDIFPTSTDGRQHGQAPAKEGGRPGAAPGEGEFREMLENFLSTFEQEIHGGGAAEEEPAGRGLARSAAGGSQPPARTKTLVRVRPQRATDCSACHAKLGSDTKKRVPKKPRKRRGRKEGAPPPQKQKDLVPPDIRKLQKLENQQLRQMPVVMLGRRGPLPERMILQGHGLQNLANTKESTLVLEGPLKPQRRLRGPSKGPQNGNVLDSPGHVRPAEQRRLQEIGDTREEETGARPQEQAARRANRRKAEAEERRSQDASGSKRCCLEPPRRASTPPPERPREAEQVSDTESLSPGGAGGPAERREPDTEDEEIIVVDGDEEDGDTDALGGSGLVTQGVSTPRSEALNSRNEEEEEEEEEEEIDVVC
ncbi:unnamed protein product [Tetraodon nigroviridis]|uniref:Chromosome 1 SCAF14749, whole genome shotgun sequence n=1 Tax=Tetraodon nigroviridis TaxID=99883 RepID=Q4S3L6_TETNG|nr:unnamed protein product [Tetraodon nigroviridis]